MDGFDIFRIREKVWSINDRGSASFYVIEGEEKAAVIDTGITRDVLITPVIREVTDKPLVLLVTHAHLDHMYHMDEFDEVYMSHRELLLPDSFLEKMACGKQLDWEGTVDITTGSVIDIGGIRIEVCELPGHTPGSVIFLDTKHDLLFTGDAIGSGCGVWMQVDSAVSLDSYYESLVKAFAWLVSKGGRMQFWGGHNMQFRLSEKVPGYNPLTLGLMADLIDLVSRVTDGTEPGKMMVPSPGGSDRPVYYSAYGRAEMLFSKDGIHEDNYMKLAGDGEEDAAREDRDTEI